ncbi:L,D-transpeptidase family protein [Stagnihabitans tardus]|uniref:L,D-transpeptidase family protein n=1 Tax=Stagnihabitans tardus TaxID=2699202 RepID=A0AAE5BV59_9RHOB|nr:L,D-transpeptidase family protein [Stagnihabitans tardus]NBZ88581.1 L,D-transpeptidase family protein [Stagnihabitans tardus]
MKSGDLMLTPMGLRVRGRVLPCTIGRSGVTTRKREGDGATPAGVHGIVGCLYRPDRMAQPVDWALPIGPMDLWSDDPRAGDYNKMVRAPYAFSHERLRRADPMYDLVLILDWNWPVSHPGQGSAIFIHRWRRPGAPTAGCIALGAEDLLWLVRGLRHADRVIVPEGLSKTL